MVKASFLVALVSILGHTSAQNDDDDCYEPEEETTSTAVATSASSSSVVSTCPPLPVPTTTDTVTTGTVVATVSEVTPVTATVYASTFVTTVPQPSDRTDETYLTLTVATTTETVYYGPTFTSVVFDIVPAEATVTIPRRADFTPVKCQSAYVGPFSTSTISYTSTISTYSYVSTFTSDATTTEVVFPTMLIFPSVTGTSTATVSLQRTTTITSTRDDPTSTVYAACQGTDNVTPDAPPSYYKYLGQPVAVTGTYSNVVAAIDQVDCCSLCQANEQCTASSFYTKPILGVSLPGDNSMPALPQERNQRHL